jgi:hypothetical protein
MKYVNELNNNKITFRMNKFQLEAFSQKLSQSDVLTYLDFDQISKRLKKKMKKESDSQSYRELNNLNRLQKNKLAEADIQVKMNEKIFEF